MDHGTSTFAVQTVRRWWHEVGCKRYPRAKCFMITCDGGGSNGSRVRLWKRELQGLANVLGIDITVVHLPPDTSSRVDDWRGGCRSRGVAGVRRLSPIAGASNRAVAPFPVAARQTGHADRPHPAFTCVIRPSRSASRCGGRAIDTGRASRRDTRPDTGGTRCPLARCVAPTSVEGAVAHTSVSPCRSAGPAPG
jgi:hypothetical protein